MQANQYHNNISIMFHAAKVHNDNHFKYDLTGVTVRKYSNMLINMINNLFSIDFWDSIEETYIWQGKDESGLALEEKKKRSKRV